MSVKLTPLSNPTQTYQTKTFSTSIKSVNDGSIVLVDGERWKEIRGIWRPSFECSMLDDVSRFEDHVQHLFRVLPSDKAIDIGEFFLNLCIDTIMDWMFSDSINYVENTHASRMKMMAQAFSIASTGCETRWRLGLLVDVWSMMQFRRNVRIVHKLVDEQVQKASGYLRKKLSNDPVTMKENTSAEDDHTKKRYILLHALAKQTSDPEAIRDTLVTVYLGGRDTTGSLLTNLFFHFAREPAIWQRA